MSVESSFLDRGCSDSDDSIHQIKKKKVKMNTLYKCSVRLISLMIPKMPYEGNWHKNEAKWKMFAFIIDETCSIYRQ